jgi:hypothetical protein
MTRRAIRGKVIKHFVESRMSFYETTRRWGLFGSIFFTGGSTDSVRRTEEATARMLLTFVFPGFLTLWGLLCLFGGIGLILERT